MCGIVGFIDLDGKAIPKNLLKKSTDSISHRGPDGEGQWTFENIGLGHRRLSIIDLSKSGKQPMISNNERFVISYNGEIYNYKELKKELTNLGYQFKSQTDTEVLLYSLIHWGEDALLKLNGMFAFAFFDTKEKKLLLARDRYGIKPLYFSLQNNLFAFGSEQKAILVNKKFNKNVNKEALLEYFTFQNIFTNKTFLDDIHLLPAGHLLEISSKSGEQKLKKYWDYHFTNPNEKFNKQEYLEELDRLFLQSVQRQLVSDVELGSYLSGGMDSGSITAIASKNFPNLKTFTCGFDLSSASGIELAFDERNKAEMMSANFKTEHYEMVLKAGDMERCLPQLAYHLEEPRVGQSYPNFYASKLASKFVKVVLSGAGGDELFGGYPWRYFKALGSKNFDDYIDEYYLFWQRLVSNKDLKNLFSPIKNEVSNIWTRDIFKNVFSSHENELNSHEDFINHSLYFEAKTFLHGLFIVEDKLSMAHGLETRVPFLDNDLVEFAMKCPVNLKLDNLKKNISLNENEAGGKKKLYFQKTNDGKKILRDVMSKYVPKDIHNAPKQGFSSPDASWFKGESIDFVERKILKKDARIYSFLDYNSVVKLVKEHTNGKVNRRLFIWSLLNTEFWLENTLN